MPSSVTHQELQDIALTVADTAHSWSDLFFTAQITPGDLSYDSTFLAVNRMLQGLGASSIDLVLISQGRFWGQVVSTDPPCAHTDFGWDLCVKSAVAAAEHMRLSGVVRAVGAFDWTVERLQKLWPFLRAPLAALQLTFDTFANSHLAALKFCVMTGIQAKDDPKDWVATTNVAVQYSLFFPHSQVLMGGFVEQPGRLVLPMFLGGKTFPDANAGRAPQISALAATEWITSKGVAAVLPGDMDSVSIEAILQLLDDEPIVREHLLEYLDWHFWPREQSPALHELVLEPGATCSAELQVLNAEECTLAVKELEGPSVVSSDADDRRKTPVSDSGCSLHFGPGCSSLDCATAHFGHGIGHPQALPVCRADASKLPEQGRTLFLSMCMGDEYFDKFCAPFLASYRMVYSNIPHGWHTMRVWTVGVDASRLRQAKDMFSSAGVEFEESSSQELHQQFLKEQGRDSEINYLREDLNLPGVDGRTGCLECKGSICACDPGAHDEKVVFNNVYFLQWVIAQFEGTQDAGFEYMVFIDSDMLFLRDLSRFLPREQLTQWEYAFTIYDQHHEVPWASNEEVARTRNGFVRINAGVQLFRYTKGARLYLRNLLEITRMFVRHGEMREQDDGIHFLEEFKGLSQAAIAWFVGSSNLLFGDCLVCWPEAINFTSVSTGGEPFTLAAQGLPARFLNQAESVADGVLNGDTHLVHLKGLWWRVLLLNATAHSTATRCFVWNAAAYELWKSLYLAWRPELVIHTRIHASEHCPDVSLLGQ